MRLTVIGQFELHHYAHHWIGMRLGLDRLCETDHLAHVTYLDMRKMGGAVETPDGMRYDPRRVPVFHAALKDSRPDAVLICNADAFNIRTLEVCKKLGAFVALWFCDMRPPTPTSFPVEDYLDLIMMTAGGMATKSAEMWGLREDQAVWMFQACLPQTHLDLDWATKDGTDRYLCDVVHIGSWHSPDWHVERRELFEYIEAHTDINLKLIDPKTDHEKAGVTKNLCELYQRSKVALGVSTADCYGYHSNRLVLATGCGGFYFCNHFPGVEQLFEPGKEIVTCDMLECGNDFRGVCWYLNDWINDQYGLREKVRLAGFKRAQRDHNYLVRMDQVLSEIEDRR